MAAALMEELLEEVLLRIPPDDPESLARAALVSKRWCRLICGRGFRRRFREFHGNKPPLLGFLCQCHQTDLTEEVQAQDLFFVPTSSFKPPRRHRRRNRTATHSCHGRVLLHSTPADADADADALEDLFVWDPIAGDKLRELPRLPLRLIDSYPDWNWNWNAVVLCASTLGDGGCDHLDCHNGHFMVVLAGIDDRAETFVSVYSSEADRWSEPIYSAQRYDSIEKGNSVLIASAVYFKCECFTMNRYEPAILKYDLLTQEISSIPIPRVGVLEHMEHGSIVLMAAEEDGRLGFAGIRNLSTLSLWSWMDDHGADEGARWVQTRVLELDMLLPTTDLVDDAYVVAFADAGAGGGVFFIWSNFRLYSLNLNSGRCSKMLGKYGPMDYVAAYISFCTPALGAVSIDEGPVAGESSA